jgi:hypothetical protein
MKNSKQRENETLAKLQDFTQKLKSQEEGWTAHQVIFHVDSERAYQVDRINKASKGEGDLQ